MHLCEVSNTRNGRFESAPHRYPKGGNKSYYKVSGQPKPQKGKRNMKTTVFAKKRTTKEGRPFFTYSGRLTRKDGEQIVVSIKFGKDVKIPETFPCNIDVAKESARYSEKKGVTAEGKEYTDRTLWVNAYTMGEPYVDNSCDDFED